MWGFIGMYIRGKHDIGIILRWMDMHKLNYKEVHPVWSPLMGFLGGVVWVQTLALFAPSGYPQVLTTLALTTRVLII